MLSRINKLFRQFNIPVSMRLSLVYGVMLLFIMLLAGAAMTCGLYYMLYHETGRDVVTSSERVQRHWDEFTPQTSREFASKHLQPGVVLCITDMQNNVIFESTTNPLVHETGKKVFEELREEALEANEPLDFDDYIEDVAEGTLQSLGLFEKELDTVEVKNSSAYYLLRYASVNGMPIKLYFFRTITAERHFLEDFISVFGYACLGAVLAAIIAGFFMSRRMLEPIRRITETARKIEVNDLNKRIPVPETKDELQDLIKTFNNMLERLQDGFEKQRRFVSDASHELRTPATIISGYSDMLVRWGKNDPEILEESINAIRSEAVNMQQLIEKLLFLARADQHRQVVNKTEAELDSIIEEMAKESKLLAPHLEIILERCEPAKINADTVLFKQMLRIFIENSSKYTPEGGKLLLSCTRSKQQAVVKISDTGIGIAEADLARVFERFYRVDSDRNRSTGGTGLGLSIAKWIADEHQAEIKISSTVGKGTTIEILIPCI